MDTTEILKWGALALAAILSIIEISPIKINPWQRLGRLIGRAINGEMIEKLTLLETKVNRIEYVIDENEAKAARVRILRFGDEIYQRKKHSKEHFENILADITFYDDYCKAHPEFKNERTKITESIILEQYRVCTLKHSFYGEDDEDQV